MSTPLPSNNLRPGSLAVLLTLVLMAACTGDPLDDPGGFDVSGHIGFDAADGGLGDDLGGAPDMAAEPAVDAPDDEPTADADLGVDDAGGDANDAGGDAIDAGGLGVDASDTAGDTGRDALLDVHPDRGPDTNDAGADGGIDGGGVVVVDGEAIRCFPNGWCWDLPRAGAADWNDYWGASAHQIWAVGSAGRIAYFDGSTWLAVDSPVSTHLRSVFGTSPSDIWAVGDGGRIIHFDGESWERVTSGVEAHLRGVWAWDDDDAWAVGASTVLRWDGERWTLVDAEVNRVFRAVSGAAADDVWIVGRGGTILHYDGESISQVFEAAATSELYDVVALPGEECWAVGPGGWVRHQFVDAGSTIDVGGSTLRTITALAFDDLWAAGDDGFYARWDGLDWSSDHIEGSFELDAIWTDGDMLKVGGRYGSRFDYDFGGATWRPDVGHLSSDAIIDFAAFEGEEAYALTERAVYRRAGTGWAVLTELGLVGEPVAFWVGASDDIWVIGANDTIARWNGEGWAPVTIDWPQDEDYEGIWGLSSSDVYVQGEDFMHHWDGEEWGAEFDLEDPVLDMILVDDETRYAVYRNMIYRREPFLAGFTWEPLADPNGGVQADTVSLGPDGRFYFVEDYSFWIFDPSVEGNEAWTEINPPQFTVQGAWGSGPTDIWVLGDGNDLRRYNGATWTDGYAFPTPVGFGLAAGPDALYAYSWAGHVLRLER